MSSDKAIEVIYTDPSKISQLAKSCSVCSPRIKEFQSYTSKMKAGIFFIIRGNDSLIGYLRRTGARRSYLRLFLLNVYAFGEHRFSSSFMGFLEGLYITIRPLFIIIIIIIIIIQSHTFATENCAIGNIVK